VIQNVGEIRCHWITWHQHEIQAYVADLNKLWKSLLREETVNVVWRNWEHNDRERLTKEVFAYGEYKLLTL
jgi:hypothetical protein